MLWLIRCCLILTTTAVHTWSSDGHDDGSLENTLQDAIDLMSNYSFAMDMRVSEDKALVKSVPATFSKKLKCLQQVSPPENKSRTVSRLLVCALKSVLKSQSNIMKDRLAKENTSVSPLEVLVSSPWITRLLELLLADELFDSLTIEAAKAAVQLSVELRLKTAAQLLLSSLKLQAKCEDAGADSVAVATALHSREMLSLLLSMCRSPSSAAVVKLLLRPSVAMAGMSAYEVALQKCKLISPLARLWPKASDHACVPDCPAVDWLIKSSLGVFPSSEGDVGRSAELCTLLRYGKPHLSSVPDLRTSTTLRESNELPQFGTLNVGVNWGSL